MSLNVMRKERVLITLHIHTVVYIAFHRNCESNQIFVCLFIRSCKQTKTEIWVGFEKKDCYFSTPYMFGHVWSNLADPIPTGSAPGGSPRIIPESTLG